MYVRLKYQAIAVYRAKFRRNLLIVSAILVFFIQSDSKSGANGNTQADPKTQVVCQYAD